MCVLKMSVMISEKFSLFTRQRQKKEGGEESVHQFSILLPEEEKLCGVIIQIKQAYGAPRPYKADPASFFMSLPGGDSRILLRYL